MKLARNLFVLLALCMFAFQGQSLAQSMHTITLNVDTENLDRNNTSDASISSFSTDSAIVEVAFPPKDFTITVENGSIIVWEAISSSTAEDLIEIVEIEKESGPSIFSSDRIKTIGDGKVRALIQSETGTEVFKYQISFKVNGERRVYKIDPKIKVGS